MYNDNLTSSYHIIQRVFRNAIINFVRVKFKERFPETYEEELSNLFKEELAESKTRANQTREKGITTSKIQDSFDYLGVNNFYQIFNKYFSIFCTDNKQKKSKLLEYLKEIKDYRDPLSHPSEEDFKEEDYFRVIDSCTRVLNSLKLEEAENEIRLIKSQRTKFNRPTVLLPPKHSVVPNFVGRKKEIEFLKHWLKNEGQTHWILTGDGGKGKSSIAYHLAEIAYKEETDFEYIIWLSAKSKAYVSGKVVSTIQDFFDLDSVLEKLLTVVDGELSELFDTAEKKKKVLEFYKTHKVLLIIDDIDSISDDDPALRFLTFDLNSNDLKILLTSRRELYGLRCISTLVEGLPGDEALSYINSKLDEFDLAPESISQQEKNKIIEVTGGSPLFIEDLIRLSIITDSIQQAVLQWCSKDGDKSREYALKKELETLPLDTRRVLYACCVAGKKISIGELANITRKTENQISNDVSALQRLFLLPRALGSQNFFELSINSRRLIEKTYSSSDEYIKIKNSFEEINSSAPPNANNKIAEIIRGAYFTAQSGDFKAAEEILLQAISEKETADLFGFLGYIYSRWSPTPRISDAREAFERSHQLKPKKEDTYVHWAQMEIDEKEWSKSIDVCEKGLKMFNKSYILLNTSGFAHSRRAANLSEAIKYDKAFADWSEAEKMYNASIDYNEFDYTIMRKSYRGRVLAAERRGDSTAVKKYFSLWEQNFSDDYNLTIDRERLKGKRLI